MSISKITTSDTGRDGLLKINEVIDKTVTGVTYSNGLLGIRTQDGTQYTANLPQMPNGIISGGEVSVRLLPSPNYLIYDVAAVVYNCQGISYSISAPPALYVTLSAGDATYDRIDIIVGTTSGTLQVLQGTPASPTLAPSVAANQTFIGQVLVQAGATSAGGTGPQSEDFLPLAGGTMTGNIEMSGTVKLNFGTNKYINDQSGIWINNVDNYIKVLDSGTIEAFAIGTLDLQSGDLVNMYAPNSIDFSCDGTIALNQNYNSFLTIDAIQDIIAINSAANTLIYQAELDITSSSGSMIKTFTGGANATYLEQSLTKAELYHLNTTNSWNNTVGVGTSDIAPVDWGAIPVGSYMYSNRNVTIVADESTDIGMMATNFNINANAVISTSASVLQNTVYAISNEVTNNINTVMQGTTRVQRANSQIVTTGNTASYTLQAFRPNQLNIIGGVYSGKLNGLLVVQTGLTLTSVEHLRYDFDIVFRLDNNTNDILFADGMAGFITGENNLGGYSVSMSWDANALIVEFDGMNAWGAGAQYHTWTLDLMYNLY